MQTSYILRAKQPEANLWFEMIFDTDEGRVCVTSDWTIKKVGQLEKGETPRMIKLGPRAKKTAHVFKYNTSKAPHEPARSKGRLVSPIDDKMKAVVNLLRNDPRVHVINESGTVMSSMTHELENPIQTEEIRDEWNDKKFKAYSIGRGYELSDLRDAAYYFGINPSGKDKTTLKTDLFDMTNGIVMSSTPAPGEEKSNLDKFLEDYSKDSPISRIETAVSKALTKGVIREKNGVYHYASQPLGATFEAVVVYLNTNTSIFAAVEAESKDEAPVAQKPAPEETKEPPLEDKDTEQLRGIAKELGISHWHTKKKENLLPDIKEARAMRLYAENLGINPDQSVSHLKEDFESKNIDWEAEKPTWEHRLGLQEATA